MKPCTCHLAWLIINLQTSSRASSGEPSGWQPPGCFHLDFVRWSGGAKSNGNSHSKEAQAFPTCGSFCAFSPLTTQSCGERLSQILACAGVQVPSQNVGISICAGCAWQVWQVQHPRQAREHRWVAGQFHERCVSPAAPAERHEGSCSQYNYRLNPRHLFHQDLYLRPLACARSRCPSMTAARFCSTRAVRYFSSISEL